MGKSIKNIRWHHHVLAFLRLPTFIYGVIGFVAGAAYLLEKLPSKAQPFAIGGFFFLLLGILGYVITDLTDWKTK